MLILCSCICCQVGIKQVSCQCPQATVSSVGHPIISPTHTSLNYPSPFCAGPSFHLTPWYTIVSSAQARITDLFEVVVPCRQDLPSVRQLASYISVFMTSGAGRDKYGFCIFHNQMNLVVEYEMIVG